MSSLTQPQGGSNDRRLTRTSAASGQLPNSASDLREGYAEISDVRMHYVKASRRWSCCCTASPSSGTASSSRSKPLRGGQIRVVAPDITSYDLSSRPEGIKAYDTDQLTADIRGLIHERGAETALLVGHDWGGRRRLGDRDEVARGRGPARHPRRGPPAEAMAGTPPPRPAPRVLSICFFDLRNCPKASCTPTAGISSGTFLRDAAPAYSEEIDRYIEASWSRPARPPR